ncbi:hypothetical protein QM885_05155 [Streptococcus mitis]|uniref:hypothetical protein n=1 Tax=Streptococcus mitis TaxID=28037 RepID=UPI0039C38F68
MSRTVRAIFKKELRGMTAVLVTYLVIVSFFSYFSQCFGNWKYVIEYVGAPFTISFTFFMLETMRERHNKIKEEEKKNNNQN